MVELVTHEIFQYWQAKKNRRKIATPPTEHKSFRCPKDSETKRGSPTKFRGGIREKNSTEKSDVNIIGMKIFESLTFLIYQSVPQRNLSAPRQKIFDGKSWYYVLMHKIFRYLTFETLWNIRWFLTKFIGTVRQKNRRKTVILMKVSKIPNILKLGGGSQEFFRTVRQKISSEERVFAFSCVESFDTRNFPEVWRGYPRSFPVLQGQKNQRKIAMPPLS